MIDIERMTEDELREALASIERQKEEFEEFTRNVLQQEQEQAEENQQEYLMYGAIREGCSVEDKILVQSLEEGQIILRKMQAYQEDFFEELKNEVNNNNKKARAEQDEIYYRLQVLHEEDEKHEKR